MKCLRSEASRVGIGPYPRERSVTWVVKISVVHLSDHGLLVDVVGEERSTYQKNCLHAGISAILKVPCPSSSISAAGVQAASMMQGSDKLGAFTPTCFNSIEGLPNDPVVIGDDG